MSNKVRNSQNQDNYRDLIRHINSLPTAEIANRLNLNLWLIGNSYKGNCSTGHFSQSGHCFSINTTDNYFQCFSCGIGGNTIELVKVCLCISFMDAVKWIIKHFNINHSVQFTQDTAIEKSKYINTEMSATDISNELNSRGITNKVRIDKKGNTRGGNKFSRQSISELLKNRAYSGFIRLKDEYYLGIHEPIIEAEIFQKVQNKISLNKERPKSSRKTKSSLILLGVTKCGICGKTLTAHPGKNSKYSYYECSKKTWRERTLSWKGFARRAIREVCLTDHSPLCSG